jgi:hypothetical protein
VDRNEDQYRLGCGTDNVERAAGSSCSADQATGASPMLRVVLQNLAREDRFEHLVPSSTISC